MKTFVNYLGKLEQLKKEKKFDEAWRIANEALFDLLKQKDEAWHMMYYQMADILAREKKWMQSLFHMGLVIHYNHGLGGITHKKFTLRLLKKINKEDLMDEFIELCIKSIPEKLEQDMRKLLQNKETE